MSKLKEERKSKEYGGYRIYDDGRFQNIETGHFYKALTFDKHKNPVYAKYKYMQQFAGSIKEMVYKNFVGDIPRGWKVINLDGDPSNCKVENLKLIHILTHSIENAKDLKDVIGVHYRKGLKNFWVSHVNTPPKVIMKNGEYKKVYPAISYPGTRCKKTVLERHKWIAKYHRENGAYPPQHLFIEKFNMYKEIKEFKYDSWKEDYIPRDFLADQIGHCNFKECVKSDATYSVMRRTRTPLNDPTRKGQKWKYKQRTTFYKDNEVFAAY